ncbi:hypothetical protein V492_05866 [Pseudogymnoascus sp. VKM F-4246]|nr:hypothetical protein V492_05866 [Pseudogymnoascus sp. VKM F-4246]
MKLSSVTISALAYTFGNALVITRDCQAPASNQATIDLIAGSEGFSGDVYTDPTGNPTVGYGHLCQDSTCADTGFPIPLSEEDGKKLLAGDMKQFESCITTMTGDAVTLNLNQFGALVSWSFNNGCGAAQSSTLISRLNNGEDPNTVIEQELPQWVYGNGQILDGLVKRRQAEIDLAKTPTSDGALPAPC